MIPFRKQKSTSGSLLRELSVINYEASTCIRILLQPKKCILTTPALYPRHIIWQPRAEAAAVLLLEGVEALVNANFRVERDIHLPEAEDLALVMNPGDAPHAARTSKNGGQRGIRALGWRAWALGWWAWAHRKDLIVYLTCLFLRGSAKRGSGGGVACRAGHSLAAEMLWLCCNALAAVILCRGRRVGVGVEAGHVLAVLVGVGAGHVLAVLVS